MIDRFDTHCHTDLSNKGKNFSSKLDSINTVPVLIKRALEVGLKGLAITDHESLSVHPKVLKYIKDNNIDLKIGLGNEIYLVEDRSRERQKYFHLIVIAKDEIGYRGLKEMSSHAQLRMFKEKGSSIFRTPVTKREFENIMTRFRGHFIVTTACLGGELATCIANEKKARESGQPDEAQRWSLQMHNFIVWMKSLLGKDFYFEVAPSRYEEQLYFNKIVQKIAAYYNVKIVLGTDAHYGKKEEFPIQEAFLRSIDPAGKEREVSDFYQYAYLQSEEEIIDNLRGTGLNYEELCKTSIEIMDKIQSYSIFKKQTIPKEDVKSYPKESFVKWNNLYKLDGYESIKRAFYSDDVQIRYYINQNFEGLQKKNKITKERIERINEEVDIFFTISEKLGDCIFAYPNTLQFYIDKFWEWGSIVGAGRGSACSWTGNYALGITQIDPMEYGLYHWRFLNKERPELPDIDIDLCPSTILNIYSNIRKMKYNKLIGDEDDKQLLGIVKVATFGTATSKNAVRISCRGYRSPQYPVGIPHEEAEYLSSLIPSDRGFVWSIKDMIYGNEEKERLPNKTFIKEVNKYEGLLDLLLRIEGTVVSRGTHASGAVLFSGDPYELGCFTKQTNGDIATQWDLHDAEDCGMTKFDFLLTQIEDKMVTFIKLMQQKKLWEQGSIRQLYDTYLHPDVIKYEDKRLWDAMAEGIVVDCFQFNTPLGFAAINKCHPDSLLDLANLTSVMRLVPEKDKENPVDRFKKMKKDISLWYKECREEYNLGEEEIKRLEKHFLPSYGSICQQEQFMMLLMDIANFSLMRANLARKVVSKKQMSKIPALREEVLAGLEGQSETLKEYIWNQGVKPLLGYGFPLAHAVPYSVIGLQCAVLYLACEIVWDTACLIINSASANDEEIIDGEYVDLEVEENENTGEEESGDDGTERTKKGVDFEKVAQGICQMQKAGIVIDCVDINRSGYTFEPSVETNTILCGLKILTGINEEEVDTIICNRPFSSFEDFLCKCTDFSDNKAEKPNKISRKGIITLIKSGAFDCIEPNKTRQDLIVDFVKMNTSLLKCVTTTTIKELIRYKLIPSDFNLYLAFWNFREYLIKNCQKKISIDGEGKKKSVFVLDKDTYPFYEKYFDVDLLEINEKGQFWIPKEGRDGFDLQYKQEIEDLLAWLKEKNSSLTQEVNTRRIAAEVLKFTYGKNPSSWEMETMGFYHGEHELSKVDYNRYGISNYFELPKEPEIDSYFTPKNNPKKQIPIYKLSMIIGTVIAKNTTRGTVAIDTREGVVNIKFTKEYFALFNKRISEKTNGKGTVIEDSWFKRGTIIGVVGYRNGDNFRPKTYKNTGKHKLYKITLSDDGTEIFATSERKKPR